MVTEYIVDPGDIFKRALKRANDSLDDMTIPLNLIGFDFYKSQKTIFQLKGPGKYADFKTNKSKTQKIKKWGFAYPLLKASGRLANSTLDPKNKDAIFRIINKKSSEIGTSTPYANFLQFGTKNMAARPIIFFGPEAGVATAAQEGRPGRWLNILNDFVFKSIKRSGI